MYIIVAGLGFFLLLEGILPFIAPKLWRRFVQQLLAQSDRALHVTGLVCLVLGVVLIIIAHHIALA